MTENKSNKISVSPVRWKKADGRTREPSPRAVHVKQHIRMVFSPFLIYKVEIYHEYWWDLDMFSSIAPPLPKVTNSQPLLVLLVIELCSVHKRTFNLRLISGTPVLSACNVIESSGWASSQVWIKASACAAAEWDNHFQWAPIARFYSQSPLLPHMERRGFNGMNVCWFPSEIKK